MKTWDAIPLEKICDKVQYGYTASASEAEIGPRFLRITDIAQERIDWASVPYCKINTKDKEKYLLKEGDVVIARTGATVGYAKCIKRGIPESVFASYLVRFCPSNNVSSRYVGFIIESDTYKAFIKSQMGGAAQPNANAKVLGSFKISLPPISIQCKIASILSTYDDLIENNNCRIKILDDMTQTIYNEWFVRFRFPGHSKVNMVKSELGEIPEGWEVARFGDVADIEWGDTNVTKKSYVNEGYDAYSASGLDGKRTKFDFDRDGIVLSAIGANCGRTWYAKGKWSCIKNTIRFWAESSLVTTPYLYFVTQRTGFWIKRGAAQPFVSLGDARSSKVIIPDSKTLEIFSKLSSLCLDQINILQKKNISLSRTRDLLLPKLISGELDVENMNIKVGN